MNNSQIVLKREITIPTHPSQRSPKKKPNNDEGEDRKKRRR